MYLALLSESTRTCSEPENKKHGSKRNFFNPYRNMNWGWNWNMRRTVLEICSWTRDPRRAEVPDETSDYFKSVLFAFARAWVESVFKHFHEKVHGASVKRWSLKNWLSPWFATFCSMSDWIAKLTSAESQNVFLGFGKWLNQMSSFRSSPTVNIPQPKETK